MTQWTITSDLFADESAKTGTNANAFGVVGPRGATLSSDDICKHPEAIAFRMYDDDGDHVYSGYMVGSNPFAPLDDFGAPNFGCTSIRVNVGGSDFVEV